MSFKELGGEWPMHCVAGSEGAQLLPEIDMVADVIVSKGTDSNPRKPTQASTALFSITSLGIAILNRRYCVGVATDYCVEATAIDAVKIGYKTTVLLDCIAGVSQDTSDDALIVMSEEGIKLRSRA
jgi:nicotinamidase/pyrazinamidase